LDTAVSGIPWSVGSLNHPQGECHEKEYPAPDGRSHEDALWRKRKWIDTVIKKERYPQTALIDRQS
jgi:hypothetical protein